MCCGRWYIQGFGNQLHAVDPGDANRTAGGQAGRAAYGPHGVTEAYSAEAALFGLGQYTLLADILLQPMV